MIERIKRWWRGLPPDDTVDDEMERGAIEAYEQSQELSDTRQLIQDSRAKLSEADDIIQDYQDRVRREQDRVRREYRKRLEVASGGRINDRDR